jgi:hypothetical protein
MEENVPSLSKKQLQGKFKDSVAVQLTAKAVSATGGTREVIFRCFTKQDALTLCSGCTLLTKVLKLSAKTPKNGKKEDSKLDQRQDPVTPSRVVGEVDSTELWEC